MELTIHCGAKEVGGSCIELISGHSSIIIDTGLPLSLSFMEGNRKENCLPRPLFNDLLSGKTKPEAVLLSHAHLDHYGLWSFLPSNIQAYCGKTTQILMELSSLLDPSEYPPLQITHFQPNQTFNIVQRNEGTWIGDKGPSICHHPL